MQIRRGRSIPLKVGKWQKKRMFGRGNVGRTPVMFKHTNNSSTISRHDSRNQQMENCRVRVRNGENCSPPNACLPVGVDRAPYKLAGPAPTGLK